MTTQQVCPICIADITVSADVDITIEKCVTCHQIFHNQCLSNWIKNNDNCPHCRGRITGSMLNDNTIVRDYFAKIKSCNKIAMTNEASYEDELPRLMSILKPPPPEQIVEITAFIRHLIDIGLGANFQQMKTVPIVRKLERLQPYCSQLNLNCANSSEESAMDMKLIYAFAYFRGEFEDIFVL